MSTKAAKTNKEFRKPRYDRRGMPEKITRMTTITTLLNCFSFVAGKGTSLYDLPSIKATLPPSEKVRPLYGNPLRLLLMSVTCLECSLAASGICSSMSVSLFQRRGSAPARQRLCAATWLATFTNSPIGKQKCDSPVIPSLSGTEYCRLLFIIFFA